MTRSRRACCHRGGLRGGGGVPAGALPYDPLHQWALYIINAIKAKDLQLKDVSRIVKGKEVVIDEFTAGTMEGRWWSDGLHQAVEAKEGLLIQNETVTMPA